MILSRAVQLAELGRVVDETETAPILISKADTPACQLCSKAFGFFSRRHHCRNWYKSVFIGCSSLFLIPVILLNVPLQRKMRLRQVFPGQGSHPKNRR